MSNATASAYASYPSLQGRTVFVTGGSSGIGGDIVEAFARQGAKVGFTGRSAEAASKVVAAAKQVGPEPLFLQSDAGDVGALQAAIATVRERFGPIGVLVNNVANDQRHALMDVTPEDFDWRVSINLRPHFFAAQAVVKDMQSLGGGAIVNLGSTSWKIKGKGYPIYATCKSATVGLTRSLARELGEFSIRVNTLTPGWIMT
ncbi:MAG: SDR family NAD(P)-dependent oxidoreductase, partial [Rhodoferax sp.]